MDTLSKTNRINLLFDFYEPLLTDKQRTFLKYYFLDDYSLGEIAAESGISRQAVYEHIKRAEQMLESYESKLSLLAKHERLVAQTDALVQEVRDSKLESEGKRSLLNQIEQLRERTTD